MKKLKPGCVEAVVEATSLKTALKIHMNLYDDDVIMIFTATGFSFAKMLKTKGKQMHAEFDANNFIGYVYNLNYENGTSLKECVLKFSAKAFTTAGPLKSAAKKKLCKFFFELDTDGALVKNRVGIVYQDSGGESPVTAERLVKFARVENMYTTYYNGMPPNSKTQSERFGELMIPGCGKSGKSKVVESIEFILMNNNRIYFIAKDYKESIIENYKKKKVNDSEDDNEEDEEEESTKRYLDNSPLDIAASAICQKYDTFDDPIKPVCSVSISSDECGQFMNLTKVNPMMTMQSYLAKDAPLVIRAPLGAHGNITFSYTNVAADTREITPKNKISAKGKPPRKTRKDS